MRHQNQSLSVVRWSGVLGGGAISAHSTCSIFGSLQVCDRCKFAADVSEVFSMKLVGKTQAYILECDGDVPRTEQEL